MGCVGAQSLQCRPSGVALLFYNMVVFDNATHSHLKIL